MKGLILILIILLFVIHKCYNVISNKINNNFIYSIGVYKSSKLDKKFSKSLINLLDEKDINLIIKYYSLSYRKMLNECNSGDMILLVPKIFTQILIEFKYFSKIK